MFVFEITCIKCLYIHAICWQKWIQVKNVNIVVNKRPTWWKILPQTYWIYIYKITIFKGTMSVNKWTTESNNVSNGYRMINTRKKGTWNNSSAYNQLFRKTDMHGEHDLFIIGGTINYWTWRPDIENTAAMITLNQLTTQGCVNKPEKSNTNY